MSNVLNVVEKTSSGPIASNENLVMVRPNSSSVVLTLPDPTTVVGQPFVIAWDHKHPNNVSVEDDQGNTVISYIGRNVTIYSIGSEYIVA